MSRPAEPAFRRRVAAATLALGVAAASAPAVAMEFSVSPPLILAQGDIKNGDENSFKRLLAGLPKGQVRAVVLHSPGGFVHAAGEIGREIREKGLSTVVDGSRTTCVSACTILFAAGVQRLYINSGGVNDGIVARAGHGLGFHEGSSADSRDSNGYSGDGTAQVIGLLYEFGVPGAAKLTQSAPPDAVYMVSGAKALEIGLATSLGGNGGGKAAGKKKGK